MAPKEEMDFPNSLAFVRITDGVGEGTFTTAHSRSAEFVPTYIQDVECNDMSATDLSQNGIFRHGTILKEDLTGG